MQHGSQILFRNASLQILPGTKTGAAKARDTNIKRYGKDFYAKIGRLGGSTPTHLLKGFAANRELAAEAGAKGGRISKRRHGNG